MAAGSRHAVEGPEVAEGWSVDGWKWARRRHRRRRGDPHRPREEHRDEYPLHYPRYVLPRQNRPNLAGQPRCARFIALTTAFREAVTIEEWMPTPQHLPVDGAFQIRSGLRVSPEARACSW